jgi:GTP-binding protein HflX
VLLHVQDAAHPEAAAHRAEVEKVLGELGVLDKPRIEVWNKLDLLTAEQQAALGGQGVGVSALRGMGLERLLAALDTALMADPVTEQWLTVPQSAGEVLAALAAGAIVLERFFQGEDVQLRVAGPRSLLGRYRRYRDGPAAEEKRNDRRGLP